ncbi:MAG: protein kinase [Pseudomonadota bacterium]
MSDVESGGLASGTELNGIYRIEKRIGKGGMGEVYVGHEIHADRKVAIKMVLPEHASDEMIIELFRREASVLNQLSHEAIVRYGVFSVDPVLQRPYLSMEFAQGPSLQARLRRGKPLTGEEFEHLKTRIAGGLAAAHEAGIIHRDVSPDNIILIDDSVARAKLIDFGIARSNNIEGTIVGDGFAGKVGYASPEQVGLAGGEVSAKSDMYALGIVLAEALTAKPMNMGGSQLEVVEKRREVPDLSEVPDTWRPMIARMLDPDPEKRFDSMRDVARWTPATKGGKTTTDGGGGGGGGAIVKVLLGVLVAVGIGAGVYVYLEQQKPAGLSAASASAIAADAGETGAAYAWPMPAFEYPGDVTELSLKVLSGMPSGLSFRLGADGGGLIEGSPTATGDYNVEIEATAPDGAKAVQIISISIAPGANETPQILRSVDGAVTGRIGEQMNVGVGTFGDDGGVDALEFSLRGDLPNGLTLNKAQNGIAQIFGTPSEAGTFPLEVVATDAEGATAAIPVTIEISSASLVRKSPELQFIAAQNQQGCVFIRSIEMAGGKAEMEIFATDVPPMQSLDGGFKSEFGYEATIQGRLVTVQQCPMMDRFSGLGQDPYVDNLHGTVSNYTPAIGAPVRGTVTNGGGSSVFVIDDRGRGGPLRGDTASAFGTLEFDTSFDRKGPHIIVVARPVSGTPPASLDAALTQAAEGKVNLALIYLQVQ